MTMSTSRSGSPLEEVTEEEKEHTADTEVKNNEDVVDCDVLLVKRMTSTKFTKKNNVYMFIRDITKSKKILDGIKYVVFIKPAAACEFRTYSFLAQFESAHICSLAYAEWSALSESKEFEVSYDLDNLFEKCKHHKKPFRREAPNQLEFPPTKMQRFKKPINEIPFKNSFKSSSNDVDNEETYGLCKEFLCALGIKLPLKTKVFISNLHSEATQEKIREVFSLAGHVVTVSVYQREINNTTKSFAVVTYDHPVEAVQAISMFHQQKLHGWPMAVHMDKKPFNDIPTGLSGIGPGLGPNGQPLKGIRYHIETESFRNLIKCGSIGPQNVDVTNANMPSVSPFVQSNWSMFPPMASNPPMSIQAPIFPQTQIPMPVPTSTQQSMNPFGSQPFVTNPFDIPAFQNFQMLQNLNQQNPASFQQPVSTQHQNTTNTSVTGQNSDPWQTQGNVASEWQIQPNVSVQNDNSEKNISAIENKSKNNFESIQNTHRFETNQKVSNFETNEKSNSVEVNRKTDGAETSHKTRSRDTDEDSDDDDKSYKKYSKYDDKDRASRESRKSSRDRERHRKDKNEDKADMLIFKHLPRSVTIQILKKRLQQVGELELVEMTGQGRALVRFCHSRDTKRCIKLFNKSRVDGQTIDVQYF